MNDATVGDHPANCRRVLVTGGAGFIGRHVVRRLVDAGHRVTVADLAESPDEFPDGLVDNVTGDLCEEAMRDRALTPDTSAVIHLAARTSVLGSIERPAEVHRVNVELTAGLLERARMLGVDTFVFASSNAVIGDVGERIISERLCPAPLTPYGGTKAAAEMLVSGYAGAFGIRAPVLRLTNVYGDGMQRKDSFIPRLMRAAASGGTVEIYGNGQQRRDLIHVHDVAEAFLAALGGWPSGPVIVGSGLSHTVNDIASAAREATGMPIRTRAVDAKAGEMPAVVVDTSRALGFGWRPTLSLVEGIRTAWHDFAPLADARD